MPSWMKTVEVSESQIEDVLVNAPALTKKLLNLADTPQMLARQILLPGGRLDLLYTCQSNLLLVELKVSPFQTKFIDQVLNYKSALHKYQEEGRLIRADIQPYILVTSATKVQREAALQRETICATYNPGDVLKYFYENFKPVAMYAEAKPKDIGIWNIHLIHPLLYKIGETRDLGRINQALGGSPRTLYNKVKFAVELRLVNWRPRTDHVSLTDLGVQYVSAKDESLPERMSQAQIELLRRFVMHNPYESPIVLGIASVVESVFTLAKNTYPVPVKQLMDYFTLHCGKHFDWKTPKARYNATHMYSNYALDLELVASAGEAVYMTPDGIRFALEMQLHKGLKMVQGLRLAD